MSFDRASRIAWMKKEARERILLLDGSWGVMIQGYGLTEFDFRGRVSTTIPATSKATTIF